MQPVLTGFNEKNVMSMRRLSISWIVLKLSAFMVLELLLRQGLLSRWQDNNLPAFIADSGWGGLIVLAYVFWLCVEPVINGIALLIKDRPVLLKHS